MWPHPLSPSGLMGVGELSQRGFSVQPWLADPGTPGRDGKAEPPAALPQTHSSTALATPVMDGARSGRTEPVVGWEGVRSCPGRDPGFCPGRPLPCHSALAPGGRARRVSGGFAFQ